MDSVWLWCTGLVAPQHVESSRSGDQTSVPCIAKPVLNPLCHPGSPYSLFLIWLLAPLLSHPFHSPLHPHRIFQFSGYAERLPFAPPMPWARSHPSSFARAVRSACCAPPMAGDLDVTFPGSLPDLVSHQSLLATSPCLPCLSQNLSAPKITLLV